MKTDKTISEIIDEWIIESDVQPISKSSYRTKILLWFRWLSANKHNVNAPTRHNVMDYRNHLIAQKKSELTVLGYIAIVKLFYRYTESANYYSNIAAGVRCHISKNIHRKSGLIVEDAVRLMSSIGVDSVIDLRDKLIITLMLTLALRTVEVERMNVGDLTVIDNIHAVIIQRKGRTDKNEALPLTDELVELIDLYLSSRNFNDDTPLFVSHSNRSKQQTTRLQRKSISTIIKSRIKAIGIFRKDITAHSLRHTVGMILQSSDVEIETIQDLLGHSCTKTTRIYLNDLRQQKLRSKTSPVYKLEEIYKNTSNSLSIGMNT